MKKNKQPALFIGRWQPFHQGHKAIIETVLKEGQDVVIAVRDTVKSEENPLTYPQRRDMIYSALMEHLDRVLVISIPDIGSVCYGRKVGYEVREIRLDPDTEAISGTEIRKNGV